VDIERDPPKSRKKYVIGAAALGVLMLASIGISKLRPAVTTLDRSVLTFDTVQVGDMVRDVRGPGTLTPEHMRIIVASTGGRVEALPVRPGESVSAKTTIVQLSNTDVELSALQIQQQLTQAYAALSQVRSLQQQQRITQQGVIAQLRTQRLEADRAARLQDTLDKGRLTSRNEVAAARDRALELATRDDLEQRRAEEMKVADAEQIKLNEQQIDGLKRIVTAQQSRVTSMRIVAGEAGQLQSLGSPQLELGQWVNSGIELARVSQPGRLKAVLRIPETHAKDVAMGQTATIDTRDGVARGRVTSIDPVSRGAAVNVEVSLDGAPPKGARADLTVDGAIEIDRLSRVMHVGRPAYGAQESTVKLFKVIPNTGEAMRVDVQFGKASVNRVEIKRGLVRGDSVILSDMSLMLDEGRIRLRGKP
jgi:multidrug efflux pump subunit AcrA (membrane-fusion protein)